MTSASLKLDFAVGGGTLTSITAYDTLEELLTGDQFNFLPIPESVLFQFFGSDQAQHQWLDVEACQPGAPLTSPVGRPAALDPRRLLHPDRPLHLDGQRVRPRHGRNPAGQAQSAADRSRRNSPSWPTRRTTSPGRLFGELSYDFTDRFEVIVSLRYDRDQRENTTETPQQFIPRRSTAIAERAAIHRPGAEGDVGRIAAQGDVALQAERRPDDVRQLQPRLPQRRLQPDGRGHGPIRSACCGHRRPVRRRNGGHLRGGRQGALPGDRRWRAPSIYHTKAEGSYFFVFDSNTSTQNLGNLDEVEYQGLEAEIQMQANDNLDLYAASAYRQRDQGIGARPATSATRRRSSPSTRSTSARSTGSRSAGPRFLHPRRFSDHRRHLVVSGQFHSREPVELLNLRVGVDRIAGRSSPGRRNLPDEEYNAEWSPGPAVLPEPGQQQ